MVAMKLSKDVTIVTQPVDCVVWIRDTASFTVEAKGEGLTYRWYFSDCGGAYWGKFTAEGCQIASLRIEAKPFRIGQVY